MSRGGVVDAGERDAWGEQADADEPGHVCAECEVGGQRARRELVAAECAGGVRVGELVDDDRR